MACVTAPEVKEIMNGCTLTDTQMDPFILSAHSFITNVFVDDTSATAAFKKELERWLTAHLIASVYGSSGMAASSTVKREKIGDAEIEYAVSPSATEVGFNSTPYGQVLLRLDTTGLIANAGKRSATIFAIKSFK